ncbi:MAG: hypothetical protein CO029_02470 [Candidatus Magasanikbacteria bacterium CG_4_9_14_0_2_um_filter_41_10]|nr:MAG: hypothetical protein AUJ37_00255 [Candidatus Magasanikbacteria bacterium CG1_02_41_34]PJC53488.1 MAG: hypothetical protein CO029_02470 [Candidatus Magasanikbacteria bacterium CG_4_9_14_0_2_um_filter_41_10]
MTVTILGIAFFAVLIPQLYDTSIDVAQAGTGTSGDPWTVCASGCDFLTLNSAFSDKNVLSGAFITVGATYASSTDSFPLNFGSKTNMTVDCQNSGAIIGSDAGSQQIIGPTTSSTIQNCALNNVLLYIAGVTNVSISGNTFGTSTTSTVSMTSASTHITISNNTGLQYILGSGAGTSDITVSGNTIQTYNPVGDTAIVNFSNTTNITMTSNTIQSYYSGIKNLLYFDTVTSTLIQHNTLNYEISPSVQFPNGAVYLNDAVSSTVSDNDIILESSLGIANQANDGIRVINTANGKNIDAIIEHNTIWLYQGSHTGINFYDEAGGLSGDITITANYNIFYNASSTASLGNGFQTTKNNVGATFTLTNDYNGYYSVGTQIQDNTSDGFSPTVGSNALTSNPYFKLSDASSSNDTELAPFSLYLDVNGTTDIGNYSVARGSSFTVDDDCTIDYSTCHATSTNVIAATAATNDTWTLAAGTYNNFAMTTTSRRTGSVTIDGAGASTIISNASASPIKLTGLASMTIQDVVVQDATSAASSYTWTGLSFDYGGTSYNQTLALEFPSDGYAILVETDCNINNLVTFMPPSNGNDVTSYLGMGTDDYHIALTTVFGSPVTMIVPSSVAANQTAFETLTDCIVPAAWVQNAFAQSGGAYTYDSATFASASITVTSGYTNPPALAQVSSPIAGIQLIDTANTTITNVTSTNNLYGISLEGTAATTVISDSAITNSTQYDIYSDSTNDNTLKNVGFTRASSTITGTGNINVQFKTRALIQNTSFAPLSGVGLTFTSDDISQTYSATTTDTGYTAYSGYLSAFTMTSSSIASNNGGFNPYAVSVSASSTYAATSTSFTLDTKNETITLTMIGPPNTPTISSFSNTTTSIQINWGSISDATYYTVSSTVPGYTSVTTTNTNLSYTGLDPATTYYFQIKSTNDINLSSSFSSVTSTITDTPAALAPPTVSGFSNTTTSIQISWTTVTGATYYTVSSTVPGFTSVTTTNTNYTYTDLDPATTYYFQTQTRDAYTQDGSFSSVTSTITDTPAALAGPTITSFTNSTSTIQVSWSAVTGASYYTVSSTVTGYETVTTTNTNYTYTGLDALTVYSFQTQTGDVYSQDGSFSSVTSTITDNHATPSAPTSFATSTITSTTIAMTWTDASNNETGFLLDYTSSTFPGVTSSLAIDSTSKTTSALMPNTAYTFRLRSENYTVASNYVTSSAIYTNPATPLSTTLSSNGQTSMLISWGAHSNPSTTVYEVYNVTDAEVVTTTTQTSAYATGLAANTSYQFAVSSQYLSDSATYTSYTTSSVASTDAISSSITMTLPIGSSSTFQLAEGGDTHTATVDSIADGVATLTIQTTPVVVSGSTGESDTIDSDGDGNDDLQITYDSVGSTSVDFTLASYTPPSSGSSGSSGGASVITKNAPQTTDGHTITASSMHINNDSANTNTQTIAVTFDQNTASLIALSTDATFADATYMPATQTYNISLSNAYGTYTVYAKLRSSAGGITVLSKQITYTSKEIINDTTQQPTDTSSNTCILKDGKPYKSPRSSAVYYVTDACTKRPFQTAARYFEYFLSWDNVTVVNANVLSAVATDPAGYMPHGQFYTPLVDSILKATTDPNVYIFSGNSLHWIVSETVFNTLGYAWNNIEHVGASILARFTRGEDITRNHLRPNGTLIKYDYSPRVYVIEKDPQDSTLQVKRWISTEDTFASLHYHWQNIITINEAEMYSNGTTL